MQFCKIADITDWQDPEFQETANLLYCGGKDRKAWEFIQVYRGLNQLGLLNGETQILGLGVGHECLIYAFTNVCRQVVATDLYESQEWATAAMAVNDVYERNPFPYQRDRLTVQHMDMTQIEFPNNSVDAIWSCCAVEHVNNFRDLHQVYREIHRVLKPGGVAALTTEFNITDRPSYEPNLLFTDRAWIEQWLTGDNPLVQGFELLDQPNFTIADLPENQPVPRRQPEGTIQIYCNDIVLNSIAFFLRKTGEFARSYDENWLPRFWNLYLSACDAHRDGNFARAESLLSELLQAPLEPRLRVRVYRRLADALYAQGNVDQVRQVCKEALPDCETFQDEDQLMPLATYCELVGLPDEAHTLYRTIEQLPSSNAYVVVESRLKQAAYSEARGDLETALDWVGKAEQELLPGSDLETKYKPKVYFRTGFLYEKMGKLGSAVRFYKLAIELAPPHSEFQTNCYRRLTETLQKQVKRSKEKVRELEALNQWMQGSKFWKLRSQMLALRSLWRRRD